MKQTEGEKLIIRSVVALERIAEALEQIAGSDVAGVLQNLPIHDGCLNVKAYTG